MRCRTRPRFAVALLLVALGCKREPGTQEGLAKLREAFPENPPPAVQVALAAAQTNELGEGVLALQAAKQAPGVSAAQLQTMEETAQSLVRELLRRAESGDARARADLELIERSRSQ